MGFRWLMRFLIFGGLFVVHGTTFAANFSLRPRLEVAAPAFDCSAVNGRFVALLDPERGMLLMSCKQFPGGREQRVGFGGAARITTPGEQAWPLAWLDTSSSTAGLWAAVYPWRIDGVRGCVAFNKHQFSAEGDLVTYLRWLAEDVYASLPPEERQRWPGLSLADRMVRLRVVHEGIAPLALEGREGSTLAFRLPHSERVYFVLPFVLDPASGRVLLRLSYTDEEIWGSAKKPLIGQVVAAIGEPARLANPSMSIHIDEVSARAE